ncbi:hypothetical protein RN001_003686 [Aquatica leii]|uniref:Regulatory protein zeste n=1 Tax=Aquatica leii TaxID=1421715 RepID=A0AAN7ST27_9COLE|nr:hypothetical protein RN001_003686 [Aquatica leii]
MENDYPLQSGTRNPTLGENYLENKWQELTNALNAIGDGSNLTSDEWKKRFTDWKYSVRMKYRKITEHRKKTGSGPASSLRLTAVEERALAAWGKVVVTGTPFLADYDGLSTTTVSENLNDSFACTEVSSPIASTSNVMNAVTPVTYELTPLSNLVLSGEEDVNKTNSLVFQQLKPSNKTQSAKSAVRKPLNK